MRARLTGDFTRARRLARQAISECKNVGDHGKWARMDRILKEAKKADSRPMPPNLLKTIKTMNLEQLERLYASRRGSNR
ncbi:hypothetical protein CALCODRAFT_496333 [Calocera cornea HHB12733]|uniref:Uncharacterized protein n=1 Tax=Calocera cornea HHB12733 TaxID=1353952 RepID=A0A165FUC1_9BASI|nr:hypothetical protein CALCODRAFT_496333 [Calocera cornea HHB12733]